MLYNLFAMQDMNVISRSGVAILIAFAISLLLTKEFIYFFAKRSININQPVDGPQNHALQKNTPTMGGVPMILSCLITFLLCCNLQNMILWIVMFTFISFGCIGVIDDYTKIAKNTYQGITAKQKILLQFALSYMLLFAIRAFYSKELFDYIYIPFIKSKIILPSVIYYIFLSIVIVGASNATNITDGLDGLAIGTSMIVFFVLAIIALIGEINYNFFIFNGLFHIKELVVLIAAIIGVGLGFLWFNIYPAQLFMGDTGSLALGATMAIIAILLKHELVLLIAGAIFCIEVLSVMLQVLYFKATKGKRLFKIAPIHHHFESIGIHENVIVIRFWITGLIFAITTLLFI